MIKVKIQEPFVGKNRISFFGFYTLKNQLSDYSIEITDSNDHDYLFVGAHNILNKGLSLEDSVDYGLETCKNITGDYFFKVIGLDLMFTKNIQYVQKKL